MGTVHLDMDVSGCCQNVHDETVMTFEEAAGNYVMEPFRGGCCSKPAAMKDVIRVFDTFLKERYEVEHVMLAKKVVAARGVDVNHVTYGVVNKVMSVLKEVPTLVKEIRADLRRAKYAHFMKLGTPHLIGNVIRMKPAHILVTNNLGAQTEFNREKLAASLATLREFAPGELTQILDEVYRTITSHNAEDIIEINSSTIAEIAAYIIKQHSLQLQPAELALPEEERAHTIHHLYSTHIPADTFVQLYLKKKGLLAPSMNR